MVFICENKDILIDASDIKSSKNMIFVCCDPECKDILNYVKEHKRNISRNNESYISYASAHFKHKTNHNNCQIELFLKNIGSDDAKKFYRKWCEPFIYESIKNCFNRFI